MALELSYIYARGCMHVHVHMFACTFCVWQKAELESLLTHSESSGSEKALYGARVMVCSYTV